jgi:hypothetical protein
MADDTIRHDREKLDASDIAGHVRRLLQRLGEGPLRGDVFVVDAQWEWCQALKVV